MRKPKKLLCLLLTACMVLSFMPMTVPADDGVIEEFHQSSVLIQANQTVTEFYAGE